MALTDAQAKIIAENKKRKEAEKALAATAAAKVLASATTKKAPSAYLDQRVASRPYSPMFTHQVARPSGSLKTPLNYLQEAAANKVTTRDRVNIARAGGVVGGQPGKSGGADLINKRREQAKDQTLSEYDRHLPRSAQDRIKQYKAQWDIASAAGDTEGMRSAHALAENLRARQGYSGGAAGDEFLTAELTTQEKLTLNQVGQNKMKMAKLAQQQAFEAGDAKALQEATADMARIMGAPGYRNKPMGLSDAHGRSVEYGAMSKEQLADSERRFQEGLYSTMAAVPGSLMSFFETTDQAIDNDVIDRNREYLQDKANKLTEYQVMLEMVRNGEGLPEWGSEKWLEQQIRIAENAQRLLTQGRYVDPNLPGQTLMRKSAEARGLALEGLSVWQSDLAQAAMSVGQNLPSIGLSLIPGVGPALGAGLMGAQAAGSRAWELNEQSSQASLRSLVEGGDPEDYGAVDPAEASFRGLLSGGVELAAGFLPLKHLGKILQGKSGKNVVRNILAQMGMEGTEEGVVYATNYVLDEIAKDPNAEWSTEDFLHSIKLGAIAGGMMAASASVIGSAVGDSAPSQPRTVADILREQQPRKTEEQQVLEDAAEMLRTASTEAATEQTPQKAAEEPVSELRQQEAPVPAETRNAQPVHTSEAVRASPAQRVEQMSERSEEGRKIKLTPVETKATQPVQTRAEQASPGFLEAASTVLGENGRKAMVASGKGVWNPVQFSGDFIRVYNQAMAGADPNQITPPDSLTDAQVHAAYSAGVNDRQASLAAEKAAAEFAPVAGEDAGLVYDDYVQSNMDKAVASEVNSMAKMLGLRVQMVDSIKGGDANADIQGSVVSIEKGNPNPVRFLFGHEMTHRVQELAPDAYRDFRDYVMSSEKAQRDVRRKVELYKSKGVELTSEEAMDEIAADYAGRLIEDKNLMNRFIKDNSQNKPMLRRFLDFLKDTVTKLTGRHKAQVNDAISLLEKAVGEASVRAKTLTEKTSAQTEGGKGMVSDDGNGHARLSLKTYREGGRKTLESWLNDRVANKDLTRRQANAMLKEMDRIYKICDQYTDVYAPFGKWSEAEVVRDESGNAVFSVVKPNGEYPMNMDFSLVCKKRRTLDAVLNSLVEQGLAERYVLDKESIVVINDVIRSHGFETACALCFVDAKRFRVTEVADQFATMYNDLVRSMIPKGKGYKVASFNYAGDKTVKTVENGINTMQDGDLDFSEIEKTIAENGPKTVAHKIAVHLRDNPGDRKLVRRGDFISTAGFDSVKKNNPALLSLYNSKKGSAGPKASFSDVQYLSEILENKVFNRDAAYAVGGVRIQSFSDYVPRLFFDYAQMIADLAAKKLPAHAYTKEALFAQQFGLTGVKINMSLVPKVVDGGVAPGLDADGNYVWQEGQSFGSDVKATDNGKAGFDLAIQIQKATGYGKNCGTIAVGVSDQHIEKMLKDNDIRMIIPYHKSGLNPVVAIMNRIDAFTDYTDVQNTRHKSTGTKAENAHFDFNAEFQRLGDAKAAADAYLAWCEENGYIPKFDKWAGHPNYYKLLIDFSAYHRGAATPQGDVKIRYPENKDAFGSLNDLIKQGLEEDALAQAEMDKGVPLVMEDIAKKLPAREAEWANRGKRYSLKTDSEGRRLTQEQVDYFKDTVVRDDAGNLQVMYHGTGASGFTVFDTYNGNFGLFGKGSYFTDNESVADSYQQKGKGDSPDTYNVYLNIKNPINMDGEADVDKWRDAFEMFDLDTSYLNGVKTNEDAFRRLKENLADLEYLRYEAEETVTDLILHMGYDGITHIGGGRYNKKDGTRHRVYIAFEPEQIKSVYNTHPTSSPDIRYSLKAHQSENRINALKDEIAHLEDQLDRAEFGDLSASEVKSLRNQLTKNRGELDKLIAEERKSSKLTSMQEILDNLDSYRLSDLHSMAEQISDSAWDDYEELSPQEMRDALREAIEGRELSPLEMQSKKHGLYVRPPSRYSLKTEDDSRNLVEEFDDIPVRPKARRPKTVSEQAMVDDIYYGRKAEKQKAKSKEAVAQAKEEGRDAAQKARVEGREAVREARVEGREAVREARVEGREAVREARVEGREAVREARVEGREAVKAVRAEGREVKRIAVQKAKLDQKARDEERIRKLRERKDTQIADIKAKHRERIKLVKAQGRAERDAAVGKVKEHYKDKEAQARESRRARELRSKISRHAGALSKKLLSPSDNQHIPKKLRSAVANLLYNINLESSFDRGETKRVARGEGTPTARTKAFQELRLAYANITSEADQYLTVDPDLMDNIQEMEALKDTPIGSLSVSQLTTMWNTIKAVESSISNANKMFGQQKFQTILEVAKGLEADNEGRRDRGDYRGPIGAMDKLLNAGMLTPESFFRRLGKTGEGIFRMLRNAQDKHIGIMQEAKSYTDMAINGADIRKLEKETHDFDVGNQKITMTTAQIMSLYELMKRQQAVDHVLEGGIRVEAIDKGAKRKGMSEAVRVSPEKVGEILDVLTPEQVEMADGLQTFMSDRLAQLGNEASMEVYGYEKFKEKNYFPIKVDSNQTKTDQAKDAVAATIAGRGFTKGTKPHANNALMVRSIFDVYADHVTDMATYSAWLGPMENLQRIFNFRFRDENGDLTGTVKGLIHRVYGKNGEAYWKKLTEDLNNGVKGTNDNPFQALIGNYKASAIGANIRVFVQQPTSIIRALDTISLADFSLGLTRANPNTWKKVKEYAPIAVWKDWGYFDADTGRQMKAILFDSDSRLQKANNALMAPAGAMDALGWSHIWNALEVETARKHKSLERGSDAFYKRVAERFNEVIDHSQVVDGILQRSQVMRSPDGVTKMATSFMSEPTKIYNMFTTASYAARKSQDKSARKQAKKTMARTSVALLMSFVANAAAQSIVDAFRDDDKDEEYWEKFFQAFVGLEGEEETDMDKVKSITSGNMGKALNPFGYLPFVKDIVSVIEGYDVARMDMESISNVISAVGYCVKSLNGEGKMTPANAIVNLVAELSRMLGTPVANLKRDVLAGVNTWLNITDNYRGQYAVAKLLYDINYSNNKGMFLDIAYLAWRDGDKETYLQISQDLMNAFPDDVNGQTIESAMKSRTEKQIEKDVGYKPSQTLEDLIGILPEFAEEEEKEAEFSAKNLNAEEYDRFAQQRADSYRKYEDAVMSSPLWGDLDDEAKDKVIGSLWKYSAQAALEDVSDGKFVIDESAMTKAKTLEAEYEVDPGTFFLLKGMADVIKGTKTVDEETISDSASYNKFMAIRDTGIMDDYTDEQQGAIYEAIGVSAKVRSISEETLAALGAEIEAEASAPSFFADFPDEKRSEVQGILETCGSFYSDYDGNGKVIKGRGKQDKIKAEIYAHYNSGEYTAHQCYLLFHEFYESDKNNPWAYAKYG